MKTLLFLCFPVILLAGCGINKQVKQIKALENCVYEIASADSIYLARTDVTRLIKNKTFDIAKMPALALAFLRQDIPLEARVNLRVRNPTGELAAVNQFEYKVFIKDQELANGFVDQKITVQPGGGEIIVPVKIRSNIYSFLSNGKTMQEIGDFLTGGSSGSGTEKKAMITIKFKPTIQSGGKLVKYPGWITIDKEVSSKILF